jgi:hypothetical protein
MRLEKSRTLIFMQFFPSEGVQAFLYVFECTS